MVQGEISIGLFTLKDIPAGTELTFDYNFERYGDKPVKCLCGTPACRGLIGGERETADTVGVQITATEEEEDLEPIMVTENEEDDTLGDILDRIIGLGWEDGWTPSLQRKLEKLARSRGITLPKCEHAICIQCFRDCYYGKYDEPDFPYSKDIEEEYEEYGGMREEYGDYDDLYDAPKSFLEQYPLIREYEEECNRRYDRQDEMISVNSRCPLCRS